MVPKSSCTNYHLAYRQILYRSLSSYKEEEEVATNSSVISDACAADLDIHESQSDVSAICKYRDTRVKYIKRKIK